MNKVWEYRSAQRGFPLALHSHGMEPNFVPTLKLYNFKSFCQTILTMKALFIQLNQWLNAFKKYSFCTI
jgi:hypothetical protein